MPLARSLAGIHVVEVAAYLPGPACTQLLAGLGARVTKVSRPGGDPLRELAPLSMAYDLVNGGKAELELDLKTPAGAGALRELAREADVLVDGLRPGALERAGLGAAGLRAANPRLVYCALSAYGTTGPDSGKAGHDLNMLALAGLLDTTAVRGEPALPGTQLADLVSGLAAATGILAALHERARSGEGCALDASMLGAARWLMAPWYAVERAAPGGRLLDGELACYTTYRTADGRRLAVAALEPHFWARLCAAIGLPELAARQRDADQQPLVAAIAGVLAGRTLAEWDAALADLDACVTPVLTLAEAAGGGEIGLGLPVREGG